MISMIHTTMAHMITTVMTLLILGVIKI
jgi:hypothetical protein